MMKYHMNWMMLIAFLSSVAPAWAQDAATGMDDMPGMNMGGMDMGSMNSSDKSSSGTNGSTPMNGDTQMQSDTMSGMPPENMNHDSMDMPMQDMSTATEGMRDPHAYADGYTLDSGPYALPGPRMLMMGDEHNFGSLLFNRMERVHTRAANSTDYDVQGWFGRDYDRLVLKAEGKVANGKSQDSRTELLWSHAVAAYWDAQLGVRHDDGIAASRNWLALGVQGLAPYWFEMEATLYAGDNGRTALRFGAEYELLFTQQLVLQPRAEINVYGKSDPARDIGSGLSDAVAGMRLRYEFTRQFAPYLGVEWAGKFSETASLARAAGERSRETRYVAGVRFWF